MSFARPADLELERVVAAYINEYRLYRAHLWASSPQSFIKSLMPQTLLNVIPFSQDTRNKECDELLEEIKNANTPEEKFRIIDLLGESARKAQSEKPSETFTAYLS